MNRVLTTPIQDSDIDSLQIGDVIFLTGQIVTCRDIGHRRLIEKKIPLPVDIDRKAIFHAGPIVKKLPGGGYQMVAIGPTTSMRMEKFEKEFIEQTGVKIIVGKGGMGARTVEGCRENKAVHCIFPAGCAVLAANQVEKIERVEWTDLGMPESLWVLKVNMLGPLIVSIDAHGANLIENNKALFNERKKAVYERISKNVGFIK